MHDFGSFWWDLGPNQLHIIIGNWLCFCNFRVLCNSYFYRVYSNKAFKILTILATRQSFSLRTSCNVCLFSPTLIVTTTHISKTTFLEGFFVFFIFTFRISFLTPLSIQDFKILQITSIICLCVFVNLCMFWWICLWMRLRGKIFHCRHCWRQYKIFASGVILSINNIFSAVISTDILGLLVFLCFYF